MPAPRPGVPLPLVAHMVARLVGGQQTAVGDVPALVETVGAALTRILNPTPDPPGDLEMVEEAPVRAPRRSRRQPSGRMPGRPRLATAPASPEREPPAPPPAPRLVRRAEAVAGTPAAEPSTLVAPTSSMVRGVVRWFDPARQTGGLRLPGLPEDVPVEPAVFAAAGVTRLFKGQEIEAELDRGDGRVRVTALRVPGGPVVTTPSVSGPIAAMGGRRPRMVMVEQKRDALKRAAARSEAEHLLGTTGVPKPSR